jgi:hypothetical protein
MSTSSIPFDIQNFQGVTFRIIKIEPVENLSSALNPEGKKEIALSRVP